MKKIGNLLVMDIGSQAIRTAALAYDDKKPINILNINTFPSKGFSNGTVSELNKAGQSIGYAIQSVLKDTGLKKFHSLWVWHSGNYVKSENYTESLSLTGNKVVTDKTEQKMQQRLIKKLPPYHYYLHSFLRSSCIDGITRESARGLSGNHLVSKYHFVFSRLSVINNIKQAFLNVGFNPDRFIFNGYAAAQAVLENEAMYNGCLLLHIGATTTDFVVFVEGAPFISSSVNDGWLRVIKDVAVAMHIPMDQAEALIHSEGVTSEFVVADDKKITVKTVTGKKTDISKRYLAKVMSYTVDELLKSVRDSIRTFVCKGHISAGVFLTGGAALTKGLPFNAENIFGVPAEIGFPLMLGVDREFSPEFAPLIGMILMASKEFKPILIPEKKYEYITYPVVSIYHKMFPDVEKDSTDIYPHTKTLVSSKKERLPSL